MTIYSITIVTSSGFPYYQKKILPLPKGIRLNLRFFDYTDYFYIDQDCLETSNTFELNAGLISALYEFSKNIEKRIYSLDFKSLDDKDYNKDVLRGEKYEGDALITTETEVYLLNKSIEAKVNLIYNTIIKPKIPLESCIRISSEEENKLLDLLTDKKAKRLLKKNSFALERQAYEFLNFMGKYGLFNIVISSFDLSPILVFGEKYTFEEIEIILRNMGEVPQIPPMEWKHRQSFIKDCSLWVYIINSGVGVTVNNLFEPYFYLLFADTQSYLGEFPLKLINKFNLIIS